jgi:hypothetical protein
MRSKSFVRAFALTLAASLNAGFISNSFADETIPAVATKSASYLNELFCKQWVRLSVDGSVSGNLVQLSDGDKVAVAGLPVALVRDGIVAHRTIADDNGGFRFDGVETGSYSLVTRTNESIAAFSLQVLDASKSHLPNSVEVRVVRPAGEKVREILRSQTLPSYAARSENTAVVSADPLGENRSFSKSHFVKADSSGKLNGQLGMVASTGDLSDMQVFVLKNGEEVARARVDKNGRFSFQGLKPGSYGFVAAGNSGFAATSFQLINANTASIAPDGSKFVSIFRDACSHMNVEVVQCCEVAVCEQPVQVVEQSIVETCGEVVVDECGVAPSCGCGGGWGGYGGGFGGGGGGGGMGAGGFAGIAGIAGLAAVAGILAANDDNNDAPIVSPIK